MARYIYYFYNDIYFKIVLEVIFCKTSEVKTCVVNSKFCFIKQASRWLALALRSVLVLGSAVVELSLFFCYFLLVD